MWNTVVADTREFEESERKMPFVLRTEVYLSLPDFIIHEIIVNDNICLKEPSVAQRFLWRLVRKANRNVTPQVCSKTWISDSAASSKKVNHHNNSLKTGKVYLFIFSFVEAIPLFIISAVNHGVALCRASLPIRSVVGVSCGVRGRNRALRIRIFNTICRHCVFSCSV